MGWAMNAVIFVYTIVLILVCFAAAMLSVAAYAVSRRRALIPQTTFFVCYIVELTSILGLEFVSQNLPYSADTYYEISSPVLRIAMGAGILASLWLMLLDILDVHDRPTQVAPVAVYVVASAVVTLAMPSRFSSRKRS